MHLEEIEKAQREMEQVLRGEPELERLAREAEPHYQRMLEEIRRRNEWWRELPPRKSAYAYLGRIAGEIDVPHAYREYVITTVLNDMYSYGKIQRLIDDPLVSDIQIYGGFATFYIRAGQRYESTEARMSNEELYAFVQKKLSGTNYHFDLSKPSCDAILPDGYRMHVVGGPAGWTVPDEEGRRLEHDCLIVSIRKPLRNFTLEELCQLRTFDETILHFFEWMQRLARSFVIVGGTGSSKSTLMAALLGLVPPHRVSGIIEEMPELQPLCPWVARLYERPANAEGKGAVRMAEQVVNTLRMQFDNVYVGEIRTPRVAWEFLQTASTVTYQTGTTLHVRGMPDTAAAIRRLAALLLGHETKPGPTMVGDLITMGVKHIIGMMSAPDKGGKRVVEIGELLPYEPRERRIPYMVIAKWDPAIDTWHFNGITKAMVDEARVWGYTISGLPVQEHPDIQYVYL